MKLTIIKKYVIILLKKGKDMITVRHYKDLKALRNHGEGEVAYVEKDKKGYIYHEDKWVEIKANSQGLTMNLYEINKSIISQLEPLNDIGLTTLKNDINTNLKEDYYLLYGKEISYFTLFEKHEQSKESLGDVVLDCLKAFDKVYSYEIKDDTSFEIWVHNQENDLATVLYLFNYKDGVVYYG